MPNPYNITEVDVPGVLGAYQNQQDRRVQRLLAERQVQIQERELEQQDKAAAAWQKFYQGRGASGEGSAASGGVAGAYGGGGTLNVGGVTQRLPASPAPQQAPQAPPSDPWDDPQAQQELIASLSGSIPAQEVMQIRQAFREHSEAERKEAAEHWNTMARAFFNLRQLPEAERPAAFQQMLPVLRGLEVPDEMLSQPDLSDRGLEWGVSQARDIEKVIAGVTPDVQSVPGVGLFPVTPGSPYPDFSAGGERPAAEIGAVTTKTIGGKTYWQDGNGDWYEGDAGSNAGGGF